MGRDRGLTEQTILGRIAAIIYVHEMCGLPSPVRLAQTSAARLAANATTIDKSWRSLERDLTTQLATQILIYIRAKDLSQRLLDQRGIAIFTLGWLSALRRSTIAALRRQDVAFKRDDLRHVRYLEIFVAHSTVLEGKGRYVTINELPTHEPLCAVRALERWLDEGVGSTRRASLTGVRRRCDRPAPDRSFHRRPRRCAGRETAHHDGGSPGHQ